MSCKRSEQCDHADIYRFAQSDDYHLLGGSCFEPKDPQTNEEWFKTLNTNDKAESIAQLLSTDENEYTDIHVRVLKWLKEIHKE